MSETTSRDDTKASPRLPVRLLSAACLLGLLGIALSLVHFIWPTPLTFALFMLFGQGAFGIGMLLYFTVILADLRRRKVL
jgi:hypothetical protein